MTVQTVLQLPNHPTEDAPEWNIVRQDAGTYTGEDAVAMLEKMNQDLPEQELVIYASRWERLSARVEKLNRKAAKYGFPQMTVTTLNIFVVEEDVLDQCGNKTGQKVRRHMMHIRWDGETPRVGDYRLLAVIEHNQDGNIIRRLPGMDEITIPVEYRTTEANCDHCNLTRNRNDTYLVVNSDDEIYQVGSGCLRDFTGIDTPYKAVAVAAYLDNWRDIGQDDDSGMIRGVYGVDTEKFLAYVVACVERWGFVTRSTARQTMKAATAGFAWTQIVSKATIPPQYRVRVNEDHVAYAKAARQYVLNTINPDKLDESSDFLYNLYRVAGRNFFEWKHIGLAAFIIEYYRREMVKQAEAAGNEPSEWVGTPGQKITWDTDNPLTVVDVRVIESVYGVSDLVKFVDSGGNIVTTFYGGKKLRFEVGQKWSITFKVKDHSEYQRRKETQVHRPSKAKLLGAS